MWNKTKKDRWKKYIEKDGQQLEVSFYYTKGGMNYFSGSVNSRGFCLSVTPVKIEEHDGYKSVSSMMFSGIKHCVMQVNRFSAKRMEEAFALAEKESWEETLIQHVMDKIKAKEMSVPC